MLPSNSPINSSSEGDSFGDMPSVGSLFPILDPPASEALAMPKLAPEIDSQDSSAAQAAAAAASIDSTYDSKKKRAPPNPERTSKFRGVSWQKTSKVWVAQFKSQGKTTYLGLFESEEDAAKAYDVAVYLNGAPNPRLNFGLPTQQELEDARAGKPPVGRMGSNGAKRSKHGEGSPTPEQESFSILSTPTHSTPGGALADSNAKPAAVAAVPLNVNHGFVDQRISSAPPPPPPSVQAPSANAAASSAITAPQSAVPASRASKAVTKKSSEKSRTKGVTYSTAKAMWKATATAEDNKKENLGFFPTEEAAAMAVAQRAAAATAAAAAKAKKAPAPPQSAVKRTNSSGSDDLFQPMPPTPFSERFFEQEFSSVLMSSAFKTGEFGLVSPPPPSSMRSPLLYDRPLYTPVATSAGQLNGASPLINFTPSSPLPDFGASPLGASRGNNGRKRLHNTGPFANTVPGNISTYGGAGGW